MFSHSVFLIFLQYNMMCSYVQGVLSFLSRSFFERPVPSDTAFIGEIGLHGELRSVSGRNLRSISFFPSFLSFFLWPSSLTLIQLSIGCYSSIVYSDFT